MGLFVVGDSWRTGRLNADGCVTVGLFRHCSSSPCSWPLMASFMRTFKFYMGTVAFGSLLIAIMQVRRRGEGQPLLRLLLLLLTGRPPQQLLSLLL
jgi:hypothetical protein